MMSNRREVIASLPVRPLGESTSIIEDMCDVLAIGNEKIFNLTRKALLCAQRNARMWAQVRGSLGRIAVCIYGRACSSMASVEVHVVKVHGI